MKIITSESLVTSKKKKKEDPIPKISEKIIAICQQDSEFTNNKNINEVKVRINSLQTKIKKQDYLLLKAKEMRNDITTKIENIDNDSFSMKVRILELLGSEL